MLYPKRSPGHDIMPSDGSPTNMRKIVSKITFISLLPRAQALRPYINCNQVVRASCSLITFTYHHRYERAYRRYVSSCNLASDAQWY